jgi:choline dehydrogenase-like flavoprotein
MRLVGGGTNANYWRFLELDFHERSLWGEIPGTGFADWPISHADLEPYYTKAEYDIGVSGLAGANPFEAPRSKPDPLPPMPVKSSGILFERGARKLGLHPFPAPVAILSQNYKGRLGCQHCGYCPRFGCEFGSKSSSLASVIRMAERTNRCEVRSDSYVARIETNGQTPRISRRASSRLNIRPPSRTSKTRTGCLLLSSHSATRPTLRR